jgi:hypothetical protein
MQVHISCQDCFRFMCIEGHADGQEDHFRVSMLVLTSKKQRRKHLYFQTSIRHKTTLYSPSGVLSSGSISGEQ